MKRTKSEREKMISEIPWVTELRGADREKLCEGLKWSMIASKHIHDHTFRDGTVRKAEGIPDRARCKNKARWRFRALKHKSLRYHAKDGDYCWSHLMSAGLYGSMDEEARLEKWLRKKGYISE